MIKKGVLIVGKFGSRTIIRRSDLEKLFEQNVTYEKPQPKEYKISECYFMGQVQEMFNISEKALFDVIKRNSVPKIQKGKFAYVPKEIIEPLLK